MKTIRITADFEYDPDLMHGDDAEAEEWFLNHILTDDLSAFSFLIGAEVGMVKNMKIVEPPAIRGGRDARNGI